MRIVRSIIIVFLAALLGITGAYPVSAFDGKEAFRNKNDILYFNDATCTIASGSIKNIAPSDGGSCGTDENGNKGNQDQVWSYFNNKFTAAGYSKDEAEKATSGIMGNWMQESAFNSYRKDGQGCTGASGPITGSAGMGIAQWCGGRQQNLADFAAERGKEWGCLGTQLEFTWHEMEERGLDKDMKGLSPSESSQMFDEVFEVSDGSGERQKKGEQMYSEYTGKDPGTLSSDSSSGSTSCPSTTAAGGIMSPDCTALVEKMNQLKGSKITHEGDWVQKDIDRCTTEPIERCGSDGGADPNTLRGIIAMSENAGVSSIKVWNINSVHGCDRFDHPVGLATDIGECGGQAAKSDSEECKKVFQYLMDNREELNIKYIIWNGQACNNASEDRDYVMCNGDHNDHIHVSFNPANGGSGGGDDNHDH